MTRIQILGPGCPKCEKLTDNARTAAEQLGIDYEIEKITDVNEMTKRGVMMTPALAVNDEVKSSGQILDAEAIKPLLAE
jgi:small redox-active disulfide protein 2